MTNLKRKRTRRSGGSASRRQDRAGGAGAGPTTAIWPGIEGGRYRPLSENDVERVHETAVRILAEIGLCDATPRCIETMTKAGCTYRVLFMVAMNGTCYFCTVYVAPQVLGTWL